MKPNYLHIWPRNTFMMIALPNTVSGNFSVRCIDVSRVFSSWFLHNHFREFQMIDLWGVLIELISLVCRPFSASGGLLNRYLRVHTAVVTSFSALSLSPFVRLLSVSSVPVNPAVIFLHG